MTAKKHVEKFFLISRGLWGAGIPLIVAAVGAYGLATDGLENQLSDFGTSFGLAVGSVLAFWSRFWPDNAQLTAVPDTTPPKA